MMSLQDAPRAVEDAVRDGVDLCPGSMPHLPGCQLCLGTTTRDAWSEGNNLDGFHPDCRSFVRIYLSIK
jgi:hypothetical protein